MAPDAKRIAQIIAEALYKQNHTLELNVDRTEVFDDYDNKNYECLPIAEQILKEITNGS